MNNPVTNVHDKQNIWNEYIGLQTRVCVVYKTIINEYVALKEASSPSRWRLPEHSIKTRGTLANVDFPYQSPYNPPPHPRLRVPRSPTMKFKPAGSRDFIDYEGDYFLESFIAFVEKHAKNSLDIAQAEEPVEKTEGIPVDDKEVTTSQHRLP